MAQKMTVEEFREYVKDGIKEYIPEEYETFIQEVNKPTGAYVGVGARKRGSNIAPIIRLEEAYRDYTDGECLEDILRGIAETLTSAPLPTMNVQDIMKEYEVAKTRLYIRVVNALTAPDAVVKELEEDIAIVPYILLNKDGRGISAFAVTSDFLGMWGVEAGQVIDDAKRNAQELFPAEIKSMTELFGVSHGDEMIVVSNDTHTGGASALFYENTLERLEEIFGGDFYILPSSIHEMIAIPYGGDTGELQEMVEKINGEEVPEEDRLTNSVYRYDSEAKMIRREA